MRNLLAFLAAVVIAFAGAGWYLGWYQVESAPAPAGKNAVKIEIDRSKIGTDLHKGGERLHDVLEKSSANDQPGKNAAIPKGEGTKGRAN
jgi:hypothetical protein